MARPLDSAAARPLLRLGGEVEWYAAPRVHRGRIQSWGPTSQRSRGPAAGRRAGEDPRGEGVLALRERAARQRENLVRQQRPRGRNRAPTVRPAQTLEA